MATKNGKSQIEIVIQHQPAGKAIWVVEHNGQRRADTGNPVNGIWNGPYRTQKDAKVALKSLSA